jgi:antitoxin ParD1/3/4
MPTRNVNLTSHYDQLVDHLVTSGRFKNASEVMRAGLHLLEQHAREEQEKLALLRSLASEGFRELDQGRGIAFDDEKQLAEFVRGVGRRAAAKAKNRKPGR